MLDIVIRGGTIVMRNRSVGFAPVLPGGEQELIDLMEGVEDIPGPRSTTGSPGHVEILSATSHYLSIGRFTTDVRSMITHGTVRNYVMGGLEHTPQRRRA